MPLVPVSFNIAHVLFVCRQLIPETGTGYWYQKTGQCVWPFRHPVTCLSGRLFCGERKRTTEVTVSAFPLKKFCDPPLLEKHVVISTLLSHLQRLHSTMTLLVQSSKSCLCQKYSASQSVVCSLMDVQCQWKQPTIHHETNSRYLRCTMTVDDQTFCSTLSSLTSHQQHSSHLQF